MREISPSQAEVSAIDPVASMTAVKNQNLKEIAKKVQEKLKSFISQL